MPVKNIICVFARLLSTKTTRSTKLLVAIAGFVLALNACADSNKQYSLKYLVEFDVKNRTAKVTLSIPDAALVNYFDFNLDTAIHSNVEANGKLEIKDGRAKWTPPHKSAQLSLNVNLIHQRKSGAYDAYVTNDWTIFRGDDLIPPAKVSSKPGASSQATLAFKLPTQWPHVNTGWEEISENTFSIDNPERRFDRPVGWMIAGKLGTRIDRIGNTRISVSAPKESNFRRMDMLTFLNVVWPQVEKAFGKTPPFLLIVGADDPMWLGGLSAPNSLYLHEDRPLVSENGTSALIHELSHMVSGIRGRKNHDWIAEGLIEFYSVELLYRAGAMTTSRRDKVYKQLTDWSKNVKTLLKIHSTGATTARAVLLFDELDKEIRGNSQYTIDDFTKKLMKTKKVDLEDAQKACKQLTGKLCKTLISPLLVSSK